MTNHVLTDLTVAQLQRAVVIKQQIEQLESELSSLLKGSGRVKADGGVGGVRRRRRLSAAGRAKIAAAARARWAKVKATQGGGTAKRRRTMSAAARAKIAAAARARWARIKAGGK